MARRSSRARRSRSSKTSRRAESTTRLGPTPTLTLTPTLAPPLTLTLTPTPTPTLIHEQDSRVYANYSSLAGLVNVDGATQEGTWEALANAWLDDPATRAALHVAPSGGQEGGGRSTWRSVATNQRNTTRGLWDDADNARSTIGLLPRMIASLRVLFYNGNFDVSCNFLGTEKLLASLGRWFADAALGDAYDAAFAARERRWFTLASRMAGYVRHVRLPAALAPGEGGELTHVVVQGGGHLAPRDQPERVGAMVGRFLAHPEGGDALLAAMCDQAEGVCRGTDVALASLGSRCALLYNCSGRGACTDEGACACGAAWAGADCADGVHDVVTGVTGVAGVTGGGGGGEAQTTFVVRPDGWQYHRIAGGAAGGALLVLHANASAVPSRALPRDDADGPAGLRVYLASPTQPWPPADPLRFDLSSAFAQAWRLEGTTAAAPLRLPRLPAGALIGVRNGGADGFHGAVRAYELRVVSGGVAESVAPA